MTGSTLPLRISVVVPTYNRSAWIAQAIRTIRAQRYPAAEIIIVDDGSTDDTPQVTARLDSSVRVIHQQNAGVSVARNTGVQHASGEWVAFLDSDDAWHASKLTHQVAAITSITDAVWCATAGDAIDHRGTVLPDGRGLGGVFPQFRELGEEPATFLRRWLADVAVDAGDERVPALHGDAFESLFSLNYVHASSVIIRRDAFLASGGFDAALRVAEDTEFFHRFAARHPLTFLTAPLFGYRVSHGVSLSNSSSVVPRIVNALASIDVALAAREHPRQSERAAWRAARIRLLRRMAYARVTEYATREARECLHSARDAGGTWDIRALALLAATYAPPGLLRGMHALKRSIR